MGNILLLEDDKSLNRGISFKLKKKDIMYVQLLT